MSMTFQAPYDLIETTMKMPSANLGDDIAPQIKVTIRNSMTNKIYSTIKTNNRVKVSWDFSLTNAKARELVEFANTYNSVFWRIYDWNDTCYRVMLMTNPLPITLVGRNSVNVRLEFEGTIVV